MNKITVLRCSKCNTPGDHKDNPDRWKEKEMIMKARIAAGAWEGWLCKCGHYISVDK